MSSAVHTNQAIALTENKGDCLRVEFFASRLELFEKIAYSILANGRAMGLEMATLEERFEYVLRRYERDFACGVCPECDGPMGYQRCSTYQGWKCERCGHKQRTWNGNPRDGDL